MTELDLSADLSDKKNIVSKWNQTRRLEFIDFRLAIETVQIWLLFLIFQFLRQVWISPCITACLTMHNLPARI